MQTYDLAAFRNIFIINGTQVLAQEFISEQDGGLLITGIEKLTQEVLLSLFTIKGSKKYSPNEGCQFMLDAQTGAWRTVTDVVQSFNLSKVDIKRWFQVIELTTDPLEEKYNNIVLKNIILAGNKISLDIQITNQTNESIRSTVPFEVKFN